MNSDTYKQAFSALHASDEIELENDMTERKANSKFHMRPVMAVCLCIAGLVGCFSTAYALDAGGVQTAVKESVSNEPVTLKAGESYKGETEDGGEYSIETSKDAGDYVFLVADDEDGDGMMVTIKGADESAGSESEKDASDTGKESEKESSSTDGSVKGASADKSEKGDNASSSESELAATDK